MYKIGAFSKITQLSIKTLHYYDEENILSPSFRDEHNGYRYYNDQDYYDHVVPYPLKDCGLMKITILMRSP